MSVPIQPVADYVVAQTEVAQAKTTSGLYLPDNAQEKSKIANVLAIGEAVKKIKVGDKVIYKSYSTTDIKINNDEFILIKEEDILAKVK